MSYVDYLHWKMRKTTYRMIPFHDDTHMLPLRHYANKVFKGAATDSKGTMGWCYGFKLHLIC